MRIITLVTAVATDGRPGKFTPRPAGVVETGVTAAREGVKQAHGQAGGVNICSLPWKLGHRWGGMFALWPRSMLSFYQCTKYYFIFAPKTLCILELETPVGKGKKGSGNYFCLLIPRGTVGGGAALLNNNTSPEKDKYIP